MKKFVFNLESVLNYRLVQEEEAKQRFGQAKMYAFKQKQLLNEYQKALEREQEKLAEDLDVVTLQHKDMYINSLYQQIEQQEERVKKAESVVEKRKVEVTKAMQNTKVLDNLKAKRYEEYLEEVNKEEQKLLDEIGLSQFIRQAASND